MAFMFETRYVCRPTAFALETPARQRDYQDCWKGLPRTFDPGLGRLRFAPRYGPCGACSG